MNYLLVDFHDGPRTVSEIDDYVDMLTFYMIYSDMFPGCNCWISDNQDGVKPCYQL